MSFIDRLKTLMKRTGMNASGLANKLGVSRQSVAYWLAGRNNPSDQAIDKIAALFGVSAVWLKTGNDDIKLQDVFNADDIEDDEEYVFIPEYNLEFGCSPDGKVAPVWVKTTGGAAYKRSFFQKRQLNPARCKRAKAEGDSMEPLICDGDRVFFREIPQGEPIRDGRIYAMSYGGALRIKRLYQKANGDLIIHSDNPQYEDEVVPADEVDDLIRVYGEVLERSGTV